MARSDVKVKDLVLTAMFAALMAVCSWISIPATVEFTMQTFAVFAALSLLGGWRALSAIAVYLLLGAVGLPVFAGFNGGIAALIGPTGGYLVGFAAQAVVYALLTKALGGGRRAEIIAMVISLIVLYAFGTLWFVVVYTARTGAVSFLTALGWCVFPFVIPDLAKMALAIALAQRVRRFI